ncbi:MAG: sterol desaturase family protein [Pseudomonadota bacterium]
MASWNHRYDGPITVNPLFTWPPRPGAVLRWYVGAWLPLSISLLIVGLAFGSLWFAAPTLEAAAAPGLWMGPILLRNFVLICAVAGGLHWYFHGARVQGDALKYDPRPFPRAGRMFTFSDQLRDNVFWTLASGVPIWTGFEVLIWMAMAHGYAPVTTFAATPVWFVLFFFLIPIWESFYFYWIHRLLHSNWLYPVHALHHRNTDVGPWSGLSMHPVEHLLYFGTALIHFVVPSSPVHVICHLMFYALYAVTTHTGYEGLLVRGTKRVHLGNFHHQLHHRFFEVNYGTLEVPWDKLFGSFHDGTDEGHAAMKTRLANRRR